ncbi:arylesterase [Gemmobacter aquarius]|uniref:Arylesterase n=1 Tax=Paragemmobacter aquarius TaxID=2169400 RepID=A0A2S0UP49_9RHOB|nr:arylesterase [Gemmobacter aquarius]AWB49561.1 arylesterase [Gemmobacter aquarius]
MQFASILSVTYGASRHIRNVTIAFLALIAGFVAQARAEPLTLVAFGDSLTQGYGLPDGDGLVPQLQAWLNANGADVTVLNAGVSGDTTAGGLSRIAWTLTPEVDAIIVTLGGNDLLRGIDPAETRRNLDGILTETKARSLPTLLVPMVAPGNFGAAYKTAFDALYPDLAVTHGATLAQPFFAPLTGGSQDPAAMQQWLQADGIHPNKEGVAKVVEVLGPEVLALLQTLPVN